MIMHYYHRTKAVVPPLNVRVYLHLLRTWEKREVLHPHFSLFSLGETLKGNLWKNLSALLSLRVSAV